MKPYDQAQFGCGVPGDCLATCLEAILELPQGFLPKPRLADFRTLETFNAYADEVAASLSTLNLDLVVSAAEGEFVAYGYTVRTHAPPSGGSVGHCVVAFDGEMVHDPCSQRRGGPLGPVVEWAFLVPLDPARPSGRFALEVP